MRFFLVMLFSVATLLLGLASPVSAASCHESTSNTHMPAAKVVSPDQVQLQAPCEHPPAHSGSQQGHTHSDVCQSSNCCQLFTGLADATPLTHPLPFFPIPHPIEPEQLASVALIPIWHPPRFA